MCKWWCAHEQHVRRTRTLTLTHTITAYSVSGNVVRVRILICSTRQKPFGKRLLTYHSRQWVTGSWNSGSNGSLLGWVSWVTGQCMFTHDSHRYILLLTRNTRKRVYLSGQLLSCCVMTGGRCWPSCTRGRWDLWRKSSWGTIRAASASSRQNRFYWKS